MSRRLLVLCPYPEGVAPSQRFKFEQYYPDWRDQGWEVTVRPFWSDAGWRRLFQRGAGAGALKAMHLLAGMARRLAVLPVALRADLVYLHLEAVPVGPPLLERLVRAAGTPIVLDVDDFVHLPHASRANLFMRWVRSPRKIPTLVRLADHVVVCTDHLKGWVEGEGTGATNISSTIDAERYRPIEPRDRTEGVVIGWSGSYTTSPYLHLLDDVLVELQRTDGVRVRVIGDTTFEPPDGLEVVSLPWRAESEIADLAEIDVGVYPLPDEEWVKGKSGLKLLQYMGMGIAAVAERIEGANTRIVREGENGFLARGAEEWLTTLRRLVRDPELRARVGREGRRTVEERYSVAANAAAYREVLDAHARGGR